MTLDEMKSLQNGHPNFIYTGISNTDFEHKYVQPIPNDIMAHNKQELPDTNYNGLSIFEMQGISKFKYMDSLHKADAINAEFKQSNRLLSELEEIGQSSFINRRLNK